MMKESKRSSSPRRRRSVDNQGRRRDSASIMLHQIFSGRYRKSVFKILPVASALISITLCLPVLLVSDFSEKNINLHFRKFKKSISSFHIPRPERQRRAFVEDNFEIPAAVAEPEEEYENGEDSSMMKLPDSRMPSVASALVKAKPPEPLRPYSLENVLQILPYFHDTLAILIYDPPSDKFIAHYSNNMRWISGCHKLVSSVKITANSLRMLFPERFNPENGVEEFALAISSADYPGIAWNECLLTGHTDCVPEKLGPILHYGSVFRKPLLPSMMAMPIPQNNHINCYHMWAMQQQICEYYLPRGPGNPNGLVFGETIGLGWDDLIPQVVWRGTDFSYLHKMEPSLRTPLFDMDVASQIDLSGRVDKKTAATNAIRQVYDELIPRWKGVVWTAEAEREADHGNNEINRKNRTKRRAQQEKDLALPWCNIKFAAAMYMGEKTATSEIESYQQFQEYGIPAIGEGMSLEELGQFKYHIDLGGGGGTTWSGTIEKLGLPGLLFHHVTPTKDYIHDKMEPWVHYVPIKEDLTDLKEKYDWAEAHPANAKRISDNAIELARSLGTPEGMEAMFHQFYEWPLQQVVEAYRPLEQGGGWQEAVSEMVGEELRPIMQCGGYFHHDCERLTEDLDFTRLHDRDPNMSA